MHREPKNPKNPLFPKDADPKSIPLDLDTSAMSAEERISDYWEKNQRSILVSIAICFIAILGFQGTKIVQNNAALKLQDAYKTALLEDSLSDFIKAYKDTLIGGFSALSLANDAYNAENYSDALIYFETASDSLASNQSPLSSKAQIGIAFCHYQLDLNKGIEALESLLNNDAILDSVRAEAGFTLASLAKTQGKLEKAKAYAKIVSSLEKGGSWTTRINQIL